MTKEQERDIARDHRRGQHRDHESEECPFCVIRNDSAEYQRFAQAFGIAK